MLSRCQTLVSHQKTTPRVWSSTLLSQQFRTQSNTTTTTTTTKQLPNEADVVIIGGGVIGCSTLYHLQKRGINAILIEKDLITSGTTWHSAGLLWRLRPNDTEIKLIHRTRELVKTDGILSQETNGLSCGWNSNGGLFIASTDQRLDEYKRLQTIGKYFDIDSQVLSPSETQSLYPLMDVSDIVGTLYSPGDGTVEPSDYVNTLARACKNMGGKIYENTNVTGFQLSESQSNLSSARSARPSIAGVHTSNGYISTSKLAICGGIWTRDICKLFSNTYLNSSVHIPLCAMRHAYVITDKIDSIRTMPCVRDHDLSLYLRVQGESLQVGGYEPNPMFVEQPVDPDFTFGLYELDWDVFSTHLENGAVRVPIIGETGLKSEVCGPEAFTPDHKPLLGEINEIKGVYIGAGFNSAGVMLSGGCGSELANYIIDGHFSMDMFGYDIKRFHPSLTDNNSWIQERSHESYAKNYSIVFPNDEPLAARVLDRKSHAHELLLRQGCVFQERHGFERPGWFNNELSMNNNELDMIYDSILNGNNENSINIDKMDGMNTQHGELMEYDYYGAYEDSNIEDGQCEEYMKLSKHDNYKYRDCLDMEYTFHFAKNHDIIGKEVKNCRNNVAVFDQSYFGKFFLKGKDADKAIEYIATNIVGSREVGATVYTEMCNENGKVECDLGVSKINNNEYYITAGGMSCTHDFGHIKNIIEEKGYECELIDKSNDYSMFSVQGPKSRELLEMCVDGNKNINQPKFDNESFPFATNQLISIEYNGKIFENIRFIRLTFVGELGWELHVPKECAKQVYCLLFKLGKELGIVPAGYRAIDSLSCQKGYLHWHEDVGTDDTPYEAGVGFVVSKKLKSDTIDFRGKEALLEQNEKGLKKKLVHVRLDNNNNNMRLHGLETLWRNGECVGYLRRASFDYNENVSIGTGYIINKQGDNIVDNSYIQGSKKLEIEKPKYEIEILGNKYPCQVSTKALFDPKSERVEGNYKNLLEKV